MRIHRDERGQTIILVALSLPLLLGFVGIATDVGALFKDKRTLQTAADAAAIAGALDYNSSNSAVWKTAARTASTANGFTDGSNGVNVSTPDTPAWPASNYLGQTGYVEVTITKVEPTIFLALFGHPNVTVLARAVAAKTGPPAACVYTLGDGVSPPGPGLTITSGTVSAPQCNLFINSNASPPISVTGGGLNARTIGTVGSCTSGCPGNTSSGMAPYSDPFASLVQLTCGGGSSNLNIGGSPNLPGCYNGLAPASYAINLTAGTYIFTGDVNLSGSGTITGTGVTIVMASGALNIGSNTVMTLSGPNSSALTYNGILFAQSSSDQSAASIAINPASNLRGIMYLPSAPLTIVTTGTPPTLYTNLIANSLTFIGVGTLDIQDYSTAPGVTSPLTSAVLVE